MLELVKMKKADFYLGLTFLVDGLLWLRSGLEKVSSTKFLDGLAGTLTKFASGNPYGWYKSLLETMVIPNALGVGVGVETGEVFAGVTILTSGLVILLGRKISPLFKIVLTLGFFVGILLNGAFWLASAWTGASTDSLNLLMLALEFIGLVYWWRRR